MVRSPPVRAAAWFVGTCYRGQPGSVDPRVAFIFDGMPDDTLIGDFGYVGSEAAGYNRYRNGVAHPATNVLRRFLAEDPFQVPADQDKSLSS